MVGKLEPNLISTVVCQVSKIKGECVVARQPSVGQLKLCVQSRVEREIGSSQAEHVQKASVCATEGEGGVGVVPSHHIKEFLQTWR